MPLKRIDRSDTLYSGLFPKGTAFSQPQIGLIYALAELHQLESEVPIRGESGGSQNPSLALYGSSGLFPLSIQTVVILPPSSRSSIRVNCGGI